MYLLALAELESPAHPDLLTTQRQPQFSGEIVGVMKLLYFSFPAGPGYVVARKHSDPQRPGNPNLFYPLTATKEKLCLGCSAVAVSH